MRAVYHKIRLPNYAVFDEERYFAPGRTGPRGASRRGARMGVNVCEDIWLARRAHRGSGHAQGGADLIVNISMSPYHRGKGAGAGDRC